MEPTGATYVLTAAQFAGQVNQPGGDPVQRQAQVERVLASFEQVKKQMRKDMVGELHRYLESGKWIQSSQNASGHTAYRRFMGKSGYTHSLHYGHFFVIQAIYVQGGGHIHDAIFNMYQAISGYWDMTITPDKPFYPRLADSQRERRLILGIIQGPNTPSGRQATSDKHRKLGVHLRAAAQLTAEIQNEEQVEKERSMDLQRMRDELRLAKQRNLELEKELQESTQIRQNAARNERALQSRLRETEAQLVASRQYTKRLQDQLGQMQACLAQQQQFSVEIAQLDAQRSAGSTMMQQCIYNMARQGLPRNEGVNAATKRPAAGIAGGEEPKRHRQN